jgi:hypothetical protein
MACSGKQSELEDALNRMAGNEQGQFGVGGARVTKPDNIFRVTRALSSGYFFAPAAAALAALAEALARVRSQGAPQEFQPQNRVR